MSLNVPLWENLGYAPLMEEIRKMGEATARALDAKILGSISRKQDLLPVEALDSRQRARLSGYLQMHNEVGRLKTPAPLAHVGAVATNALIDAANCKIYGLNGWGSEMLQELSELSGHPQSLVGGVIVDWANIKPRSTADWRRIWTGE